MTLRMRGSMVVAGSLLLLGAETPQHSHTASSDGWTFTWQTVTTLDAEGRHTTDSASLPVQVARGRVRIGFPAGSSYSTGMTRGGYIILDSGSSTMTFVMPTQKMAMEVSLRRLERSRR